MTIELSTPLRNYMLGRNEADVEPGGTVAPLHRDGTLRDALTIEDAETSRTGGGLWTEHRLVVRLFAGDVPDVDKAISSPYSGVPGAWASYPMFTFIAGSKSTHPTSGHEWGNLYVESNPVRLRSAPLALSADCESNYPTTPLSYFRITNIWGWDELDNEVWPNFTPDTDSNGADISYRKLFRLQGTVGVDPSVHDLVLTDLLWAEGETMDLPLMSLVNIAWSVLEV